MEANRDDAVKSLRLARKHFEGGNLSEARRLADKSISLFPTAEAKEFLATLASAPSPSSPVNPPMASGTETHLSAAGTHSRKGKAKADSADGGEKKWTPEQAAVVKRVRSCGVTAYYEVLSIEKSADENDVKRAYRKLALQLHPDKNNAPGADEAFKIVSKAFTILSDPQKRAVYDQVGGDPEQRGGGGSAASSGMGGMNMRPGFNPMFFDEEINPEDVFNMFFGAAGFGGPGFSAGFGNGFGGGPMFSASFGGPRIRVQRFGGTPRRQAGQQQTAEMGDSRSIFVQLLPLIALLAISLFSSLFSFITTGGTPSYPGFRYDQIGSFKVEQSTTRLNVPYFVSPKEWAEHPIGQVAEQVKTGTTPTNSDISKLRSFEAVVERRYEEHLYDLCRGEFEHRERRIDQNKGIFGFGADWEKVRQIQNEKLPHCEKFNALQLKQKTHKR